MRQRLVFGLSANTEHEMLVAPVDWQQEQRSRPLPKDLGKEEPSKARLRALCILLQNKAPDGLLGGTYQFLLYFS